MFETFPASYSLNCACDFNLFLFWSLCLHVWGKQWLYGVVVVCCLGCVCGGVVCCFFFCLKWKKLGFFFQNFCCVFFCFGQSVCYWCFWLPLSPKRLLLHGSFFKLWAVWEVIPVCEEMDKEVICTALVKNHGNVFTLLLGWELDKYPSIGVCLVLSGPYQCHLIVECYT